MILAATLTFTGFLTARGINVSSPPSWVDGGFGRLEAGGDRNVGQAEAQLGVDWTPTDWAHVHAHGIARDHGSGLIEAYLDLQKDFGRDTIRLRSGEFFLPTSRENVDALWSSPYTISYSVLNTWIGEELRPLGSELQWQHLGSTAVFTVAGSAFCCNDTMGALLAWRGWSMGNRLTTYNAVLPLPPLFSLSSPHGFADQMDGTKPFESDLDGRAGWSGRARVSLPERATLQFTHVDNRGDRQEYRGEYSWQTKLNLLGGDIRGQHGTTFAAEYGWGATGMGFRGHAWVQATYYAAYALVSQSFGRNRLSARIDVFGTEDKDHSPVAENNTESGRAWTLAYFYEPTKHLRFGTELANIVGDRIAAAQSGADPNLDGRTFTLEARFRF
jgi:hypothetical protein